MSVTKLENFIKTKKKIYVAIDLDNTIINYDDCFSYYLSKYNIALDKKITPKELVKKNVSNKEWVKIQGIVYGRMISKRARLNYGLLKYLKKLDKKKYIIDITSLKTKLANGQKKINLREVANKFLKKNKIYNYFNRINYFDTFEDKVNFINDNKYSIVIDDHLEILENISPKVLKINFSNCKSNDSNHYLNWFGIDLYLNNQNDTTFLKNFFKKKYSCNFKTRKINKGGNSNIFRVYNKYHDFKVKLYSENENIEKIKKEIFINNYFFEKKLDVKKIKYFNANYFLSYSEWIKGRKLNKLTYKNIKFYTDFLYKLKKIKLNFNNKLLASASCLNVDQVRNHFDHRIAEFNEIKYTNPNVYEFINNYVNKTFNTYLKKIMKQKSINKYFNQNIYFLSPSDYGIHNSLKFKSKVFFFDFEYAGFDSSIKIICDFIYNPSNKIYDNVNLQSAWINECCSIFFIKNPYIIQLIKPLFGLIWCLIILNEYKYTKWIQRSRANNNLLSNRDHIKKNKFVFSKNLYDIIVKDIQNVRI